MTKSMSKSGGLTIESCVFIFFCFLLPFVSLAGSVPSIETLQKRSVLDDYYSAVLFGYNIINHTKKYAGRYVGNQLNCTDCHRNAGTEPEQIPLYVAGVYPRWRAKTSQSTSLGQVIRECFVNGLNGIMPPENAAEITAIKTYINYLSYGQVIGQSPSGRGVRTLSHIGSDPSPMDGELVYQKQCASCHGVNGDGVNGNPPTWGMASYTEGSPMNSIPLNASFIKTKMQMIQQEISTQDALDVAAFLKLRKRPADPGNGKINKLLQGFARTLGLI